MAATFVSLLELASEVTDLKHKKEKMMLSLLAERRTLIEELVAVRAAATSAKPRTTKIELSGIAQRLAKLKHKRGRPTAEEAAFKRRYASTNA